MNKEGSYKPLILVMGISILIATFWDKITFLKNAVHYLFDPTLGWLLRLNLTLGMFIIVFIIALISIIAQKYGTDQKTLKEIKHEQKKLQEEMKAVREHPEKLMALQKKQMEFIPQTMKLSTRPIIYTGIPFILLFRWFSDLFTAGNKFTLAVNPTFFNIGWLTWFWFYLIFTLVFSMILRKVFKVV